MASITINRGDSEFDVCEKIGKALELIGVSWTISDESEESFVMSVQLNDMDTELA